MLSININRIFLPVKLSYFLYISAWAVIKPYLPIFWHELGMNAAQIGLLRSIEPVTNLIASPFWGAIADKLNIHKHLMLACVLGSAICIPLYAFVPNVTNLDENRNSTLHKPPLIGQSNYELTASRLNLSFTSGGSQAREENTSTPTIFSRGSLLSFTLCGLITTSDNIFNAGFMPLFDSNTVELCGTYPGNTFGGQRAMGALAVAVVSPVVGYLFDVYKTLSFNSSYFFLDHSLAPFFFIYTVVMLPTVVPVSKLEVVPMQAPESFSKEVLQLFQDKQILVTFLVVVVCGASKGITAAFLLLYLEELHASRLIMSLTLVMTCAPETICLIFSGRVIKTLTYEGVFCLGLIAYVLRFLGYSIIPENAAWMALPIEALHGICYGLLWPNCTEYANYIAPKGMSATLQSIMNSVHAGIGEVIGIVAGGFIYNSLGARNLFHLSAATCFFTLVIYAVSLKIFVYRKNPRENNMTSTEKDPLVK